MGELLEECFVARGGTARGEWWFTAFFHAVYVVVVVVVVECSRVPPLLTTTDRTHYYYYYYCYQPAPAIADAEITAFYLTPSHADALTLSRRDAG